MLAAWRTLARPEGRPMVDLASPAGQADGRSACLGAAYSCATGQRSAQSAFTAQIDAMSMNHLG